MTHPPIDQLLSAVSHCVWRSQENQELILSYYMGSGAKTQVLRLGSRHLYPLGHLAGPQHVFLTTGEVGESCTSEQGVSSRESWKRQVWGDSVTEHWLINERVTEQTTQGSTGTCLLVTALQHRLSVVSLIPLWELLCTPHPASLSLEQRRKSKEGKEFV